MGTTVVAVFDNQSDAQQALDAVIESGIASINARIASSENISDTTESTSRPDHEESFGDKIANFFGFGDQDETYSEAVRRGSYVLTVDAQSDDEAERASDIINEYGPIDIDEREAEWRDSGWQASPGAGNGTPIPGSEEQLQAGERQVQGGETTIPIIEEQMQIGKREVQRGGVRVISRTTERPVEETVNLHEERATVQRRPVDRAATESDTAFKDQSFEVRGTAEEAVISKTARVVEEVVIGKESSTRDQSVEGNVRSTDVEVEQLGEDTGTRISRNGESTPQPTMGRYSGAERRRNTSANYSGAERRA